MSMELLLIIFVTLIVFGPKKLPMLAAHLGLLMRHLNKLKAEANSFWLKQLNQYQLEENKHKAEEADKYY